MRTQPPSSEKVQAAEGSENFASLISLQASHTWHKYFFSVPCNLIGS